MTLGLAEAGADIAGLYNTNYEETQARVEALGRRFLPVQCNLLEATVACLNEVVGQGVEEMGGLDILVNNAGITRRAPALEFSEQDWDDVIQVDLKVFSSSRRPWRKLWRSAVEARSSTLPPCSRSRAAS